MWRGITLFLRKPMTIVGIVTAVLFQVIFSSIWMTAYKGVNDRSGNLSVGIVNEDSGLGAKVVESLEAQSTFHLISLGSAEEGMERLNARELQMLVTIPPDFTKKATSLQDKAELKFTVNESNPALIKSIMTSAAGGIAGAVNGQAVQMGTAGLLEQLNAPGELAKTAAAGLGQRVVADIQSVNPVKGMNNQMVPMMLVLASYVGAMIMGMNFEQASMMLRREGMGKWHRLQSRFALNFAAAILVSLIGTIMLFSLGGQHGHGFLAQWGFQALFVAVFMFVSQMFLVVLGMPGMLFNILLLSVQLVTSGAMVPRELLSGFYSRLGDFLPATYAVQGCMNLLFGGAGTGKASWLLVAIGAAAIVISAAGVAVRKETARQAEASPATAS
ncbi:YhgE/Pip domain-containing protein [Paenibacillus humicus]|uniref:YhgE/Pip domain-containing protein n=1 Tax=Paenibacillus humicus TaxID=412861 RepID=UPI003F17F7FF